MRALAIAAAAAAIVWGTTIGAAPAAVAAAPDSDCIAGLMNTDGSCTYANCSEARADGVCDIPEGSEDYCSKQDRDNDGIACEC